MIKLPPMMSHPECHTYVWTDQEKAAIRARDIEVARLVLEAAAKVCEVQSDTGSINQQWMRERCAEAIRNLEISHD